MNLNEKIKEIQGDISDADFATKLNISRSQLWRVKNSKSKAGINFIKALKSAYPEIDTDLFFDDSVAQSTQEAEV